LSVLQQFQKSLQENLSLLQTLSRIFVVFVQIKKLSLRDILNIFVTVSNIQTMPIKIYRSVNRFYIALFAGLWFSVVFVSSSSAQQSNDYESLAKFRKWTFVAGPRLYFKARTEAYYGDYTFKNKLIPGYQFGVEYEFRPAHKWSIVTGLLITKEPVYSIEYRILQKDLFSHYTEDFVDKFRSYAISTFSFPLLYRVNLMTGNNSFISIASGIKFMYFPSGDSYFGLEINDDSMTRTIEIFGLNLHSQNYSIYESFVLTTGFTFVGSKYLFKPSISTVINFQPTIIGEYQYGNLLSSPPAKGSYKLSGNYVSLNLGITLRYTRHLLFKVKIHTGEEPTNND
jgi:hypothetical protein